MYIDLHCHPIPGLDDGARTLYDGVALLAGLARLGFSHVVATPHIRTGLWANRRATIEPAAAALHAALRSARDDGTVVPELSIAAEHLFDDVSWELFVDGQAMLYPGASSALIEFLYDVIPLRVEMRIWRLCQKGIVPVLAHPERYSPLAHDSERLEELVGAGARPLLDVMSLVGAYGRTAKAAAERILGEGLYAAACTDAHKSADLPTIESALAALDRIVGAAGVRALLVDEPARLIKK